MRKDMVKTVRERYRNGIREPLIRFKNKPQVNDYEDFDGGPHRTSMTKEIPARSWVDRREPELLYGPLIKFLRSQVGRKWDDVWSEICEVTAGETGHAVREWVRGNVEILSARHKDRLMPKTTWFWNQFFVLDDGILQYQPRHRYRHERQQDISTVRVNDKIYHCHNDLWYEIELAPFPKFEEYTRAIHIGNRTLYHRVNNTVVFYDLFLGTIYARSSWDLRRLTSLYGEDGYCVSKRSINSKEVKIAKKALEKARSKRS